MIEDDIRHILPHVESLRLFIMVDLRLAALLLLLRAGDVTADDNFTCSGYRLSFASPGKSEWYVHWRYCYKSWVFPDHFTSQIGLIVAHHVA